MNPTRDVVTDVIAVLPADLAARIEEFAEERRRRRDLRPAVALPHDGLGEVARSSGVDPPAERRELARELAVLALSELLRLARAEAAGRTASAGFLGAAPALAQRIELAVRRAVPVREFGPLVVLASMENLLTLVLDLPAAATPTPGGRSVPEPNPVLMAHVRRQSAHGQTADAVATAACLLAATLSLPRLPGRRGERVVMLSIAATGGGLVAAVRHPAMHRRVGG